MVANTTAETEGLRKIAESDELQLYDSALEVFLSEYADADESSGIDVDGDVNLFMKNMDNSFEAEDESSGGRNKVPPHYEFQNEFQDESPTDDLQNFFDGYKFVVDY